MTVVYSCPNCTSELGLPTSPVQPVLHPCRGLKGLLVPMVPQGTDCKVEANEREDYIGGEHVRYDGDNRPIMNTTTTYADGHTDCTVYAPTATGFAKEID